MLIINADYPLLMLLGSKNPQISLKLAEIRTDQNGKVGTCAQAHFYLSLYLAKRLYNDLLFFL